MKKSTFCKLSINRSGLKQESFPMDCNTMAIITSSVPEAADKIKKAYINKIKGIGVNIEHQKDINYKKPFWKFWGMRDCTIAIFKIIW